MSKSNRIRNWAFVFMSLAWIFVSCQSEPNKTNMNTGKTSESATNSQKNTADSSSQSTKPVTATQGSDGKVVTDLFTMDKVAPEKASIGETYKVVINLKAVNNLSSIQVKLLNPVML